MTIVPTTVICNLCDKEVLMDGDYVNGPHRGTLKKSIIDNEWKFGTTKEDETGYTYTPVYCPECVKTRFWNDPA